MVSSPSVLPRVFSNSPEMTPPASCWAVSPSELRSLFVRRSVVLPSTTRETISACGSSATLLKAIVGGWARPVTWMDTRYSETLWATLTASIGVFSCAEGFGARTVDAGNSEFPGLHDFRSAARNLLQAQTRVGHRDAPGDRHRLQRAAGRDVC